MRHNRDPSGLYLEAVRTLEKLEENGEGSNMPRRAAAQAMEGQTLEAFKSVYGVDTQSEGQTCVSRLLGHQCKRGYRNSDHPHDIPHKDHVSLWLDDGEPAVYAAHLYDLPHDYVDDIMTFAEEHGLSVTFDSGCSWYFPANTTLVAVEAADRRE